MLVAVPILATTKIFCDRVDNLTQLGEFWATDPNSSGHGTQHCVYNTQFSYLPLAETRLLPFTPHRLEPTHLQLSRNRCGQGIRFQAAPTVPTLCPPNQIAEITFLAGIFCSGSLITATQSRHKGQRAGSSVCFRLSAA